MYRKLDLPSQYNASEVLFRNAEPGRADKVAIYYNDKKMTYRELIANACRVGNVFKDLAIPYQSRIMLLMHNTPFYPAAFFGGIRAGYQMALASTLLKTADYERMINDCQARTLVLDANLYGEIEPILNKCPSLKEVIVIGKDYPNAYNLAKLMENASPELEAAPTKPQDIAFFLLSSGSTGSPKGIAHMQESLAYMVELESNNKHSLRSNETIFAVSKLFLAGTFENLMITPYGVGASTILLAEPPTPEIVFNILEKYKVNMFWAPPHFYKTMLEMAGSEKRDLSNIRHSSAGTEKLPESTIVEWKKRYGLEIVPELGITEMLVAFIITHPGEARENSVGKAAPGYDIKIVDDQGKEVKQGEKGVLMVRGGTRAAYYLNNPEKSAFAFLDDWFYTNDIFHQDEDGYYFSHGRADDMFKIRGGGGLAVFPLEIESVLMGHPAVKECLVSPAKDKSDATIIKAEIVLSPGYDSSSQTVKEKVTKELQELCETKLTSYKVPEEIVFVKEFPKVSFGKIKRKS